MVKKGDTLIEVTLAVGIFSLVAIAVVAVVNSSTSGAQSSLETTLARAEIDSQAEALRFIQASYVNSGTANKATATNKYKTLWQNITSRAAEPTARLDYNPSSCQELYDVSSASILKQNSTFIINPRKLGSDDVDSIVLPAIANSALFNIASTYPRIIYEGSTTGDLLSEGNNIITRIEGLYIMAVKGPETMVVPEGGNTAAKTASAYFDFYIRSCWYAPGANTPSTISTVIRLHNPDVVKVNSVN
jgi:type II secretory pathway pseudopilin PulG